MGCTCCIGCSGQNTSENSPVKWENVPILRVVPSDGEKSRGRESRGAAHGKRRLGAGSEAIAAHELAARRRLRGGIRHAQPVALLCRADEVPGAVPPRAVESPQ